MYTNQNNAHGLACDGLQIAKDDLHEIENMKKQNDAMHELFQNAARIRGAMKSNRLLRPIFRKYKRACREILQQKNDEVSQLTTLCDYCDNNGNRNNHDGSNHDLKDIQCEMREIYDKTKSLEEIRLDPDSESDFDSSDSDNEYAEDAEDDDHDDEDDEDDEDDNSVSSASSASSSSSLSDLLDMENFS
jgi:hypothetical protein